MIKREKATVALDQISQITYGMLRLITKTAKDFEQKGNNPDFHKEFETKRSLIRRSIELSSAEKIKSAESKFLEFIETPVTESELLVLQSTLKKIHDRFLIKIKEPKDRYNKAASSYNSNLNKIYNKPVVKIMKMRDLTEL
jgi:hypothetical protein